MGVPVQIIARENIAQGMDLYGRRFVVSKVRHNMALPGVGDTTVAVDLYQGDNAIGSYGFANEDEAFNFLTTAGEVDVTEHDNWGAENKTKREGFGLPDGLIKRIGKDANKSRSVQNQQDVMMVADRKNNAQLPVSDTENSGFPVRDSYAYNPDVVQVPVPQRLQENAVPSGPVTPTDAPYSVTGPTGVTGVTGTTWQPKNPQDEPTDQKPSEVLSTGETV